MQCENPRVWTMIVFFGDHGQPRQAMGPKHGGFSANCDMHIKCGTCTLTKCFRTHGTPGKSTVCCRRGHAVPQGLPSGVACAQMVDPGLSPHFMPGSNPGGRGTTCTCKTSSLVVTNTRLKSMSFVSSRSIFCPKLRSASSWWNCLSIVRKSRISSCAVIRTVNKTSPPRSCTMTGMGLDNACWIRNKLLPGHGQKSAPNTSAKQAAHMSFTTPGSSHCVHRWQ